ncbi:MAG TPA: DNA-binding protein [Fusibacter sp.]|nr:DNA-binding protein [Fusibacter sp.]
MILAVDTSCYTTSMIVIAYDSGQILFELNKNLAVKPGERGLRQSEGFFQHVHQLTTSFEALSRSVDVKKIRAIAVSSRPRPLENSYMPVFHAGLLFCTNIANALGVPLGMYSHQEGHLMAAIRTSGLNLCPELFYGLHLSGGTTEILKVKTLDDGFEETLIGGTLDLNFGQLIDRIGVKLGLPFPCGKEMDALAKLQPHDDAYKMKLKTDLTFNLSGLENKYVQLIETHSASYICSHIFNTIAGILIQLIKPLPNDIPVVLSGGVASNSLICNLLERKLKDRTLYFAQPEYARDNALGIAELYRRKLIKEL